MIHNHETLATVGSALYGALWQSELARELEVSVRTMQRWAAGTHVFGYRPAWQVAKTELTPIGEQYVIPGCEKHERPQGSQLKLWEN